MPKIKEIYNTIVNIFKMNDKVPVVIENCGELWAHEALRVFVDKLADE